MSRSSRKNTSSAPNATTKLTSQLAADLGKETWGDTAIQRVGESHRKLTEAADQVKAALIGRDAEVDLVMASLISGIPMVLFGPPGTAKSACIRMIADQCTSSSDTGGGYFEYLMTNHTMPEELFGAADIESLLGKDGRPPQFVRDTTGMLPEAEFVFLDEVFRGGGHILNTMLSVLNERRYHNGQKGMDLPLIGLIGAANDAPRGGDDLAAFYDRFPLRVWVTSVLEERRDSRENPWDRSEQLLETSIEMEKDSLVRSWSEDENARGGTRTCSTDDFRIARAYLTHAMSEVVPEDRFEAYQHAFMHLRLGYGLSDRSFSWIWRFGCALDWFRHKTFDPEEAGDAVLTGHYDALALTGRDQAEWNAMQETMKTLTLSNVEKSKH